jgi:hypothetical protein
MGEGRKHSLLVHFDGKLRLELHGATITSDAGLLAYRELDSGLRLTEIAESFLHDVPHGMNTQQTLDAQLRQSVFSRLAGYEDTNDAEQLSIDPAMRQVVGGRAINRTAASTSQVGRFETEILTLPDNLETVKGLSGAWIDRLRQRTPMKKIVLDMESSVSETFGRQEGTAYNGHSGCTCYHPLFCFNNFGDLEGCLLREGNVHSAKNWKAVLDPIVARYRDRDILRYFRGDAAFGNQNIYSYLESKYFNYAIRLRSNEILNRKIEHLMTRPVGRPPIAPIVLYHEFMYQATAWDRQRRVITKVEWHRGELFSRVGFIATNLHWRPKDVVRFYKHRGTVEQMIKEGKNAVKWTRLSCHGFVDNQVRLQLFALAYNLGNFFRQVVLPKSVRQWTMTTLREEVIKIGAKVVCHARYIIFQMAEVAVSQALFAAILRRIEKLRLLVEASG